MEDGLYIRVKQALAWLKRKQGILQKDIADKMGMAEPSFTRALARIKEKNDEDFVISFHSAVSDYISLDYLLHGTGVLVIGEGEAASPAPPGPSSNVPDMSSVFNAALAAKDHLIEELQIKYDKMEREKDARIAELKDLAEERLRRIAELRRIIDAHNLNLSDYPFQVGMAEGVRKSATVK